MNQDLAFMVCAELYQSGTTPDLVSAAQISTLWNVAATPWLYRSLALDFESSKLLLTSRLVKNLLKLDNEQPVYRHYVQSLKIKMPSIEANKSQRRLDPGMLNVFVRLVPLLSKLKSFTWGIPEPMPKSLLEALNNHPSLSNRAALFTCRDRGQDCQYLENLGTTANLSELVLDFRPRRYIPVERLADLMFYQNQLLLRQPTLKSLTVKYRHQGARPPVDRIQMEREERLPSIERLSLEGYCFGPDYREIKFHMNAQCLRSLTLVACTNVQLFLLTAKIKLSQLIIRGPRWEIDPWPPASGQIVLGCFLCKGHGFEELELESLGIPYSIVGRIVKNNGGTIRKLRLHNFEHAILQQGNSQPVSQLNSIPWNVIHRIRTCCPHLRSLELDLSETDIIGRSDAARTFETFSTLKHLQINTQLSAPAIGPSNPYMAVLRVRNLACEVWSRSLQTFRLVTRSFAQDGTQLGGDGSWLATLHSDDPDYVFLDERDIEVVDEVAAAAERKLRVWARAVGVPFDPPTDQQERLEWEERLRHEVVDAGVKALKALQ